MLYLRKGGQGSAVALGVILQRGYCLLFFISSPLHLSPDHMSGIYGCCTGTGVSLRLSTQILSF